MAALTSKAQKKRAASVVASSLGVLATWAPLAASASPQHANEGLLGPIMLCLFGVPASCAAVISVVRAILRPNLPARLGKILAVAFLSWLLSLVILLWILSNMHGPGGDNTGTFLGFLALAVTVLLTGRVAFKPINPNEVADYN